MFDEDKILDICKEFRENSLLCGEVDLFTTISDLCCLHEKEEN